VSRYRTVVLAVVVGAVCLASAQGQPAAGLDAAAAGAGPGPGNPLWTIQLGSLSATGERPIFLLTRRPSVPVVLPMAVATLPPPPAAAVPEPLRLTLLGTVVAGDGGIAICLDPATGSTVRVRSGEGFEGWSLRSVRAREATFVKAEQRALLALPSPDDPPPRAPTAQAPVRSSLPPRLLPPEKLPTAASAPPWAKLLKR
jgi:general secretion pathway protein N